MAVTLETPIASSVANGATTVFPHSFTILDSADLVVTGRVGATTTTYIEGTDYTVSGVGTGSGSVTFGTAPANGTIVTRYRATVFERSTDYQDNGDLLADTVNADFDRLWFALQGVAAGLVSMANTLRAPTGETLTELPTAATRALKLLAFDSAGNPTLSTPSSGSATELATLLADKASATNGAGISGFDYRLPYALQSAGWGIKEAPGWVNALLMVDPTKIADIKAGTSTYNAAVELQAALTAGPTMFPAGTYKTGTKLVANYSVQGAGMKATVIAPTSNSIDALEIADSADFMRISDLRIAHSSNGTGRGLVLKNNNNDVVIERFSGFYGAVGIDSVNVAFRQVFRDCRIDFGVIGYRGDGRDAALAGAGTTIMHDRSYVSNGIQTGWVYSYFRSVDFIQPAADVSGWGSGIVCLGVGHLNIMGGHFEGSPGSDGQYISYTTSGNLSHGMSIQGLCIEAPTFATGRNYRLLNIQANDDHVRVMLDGVNIRSMAGDLTNVYLAKISGAVGSRVTIIATGCDFGAIDGKFDLSAMSGDVEYRKIDSEKAILASGQATIQSGDTIATGVTNTDAHRVLVQVRRDDGALPTVAAHVVSTVTLTDTATVKFSKLSDGTEQTGVSYTVDWWVTT